MAGLSEIADALVRLADAADRAVFVAESWSVYMGIVDPADVGMVVAEPSEEAQKLD